MILVLGKGISNDAVCKYLENINLEYEYINTNEYNSNKIYELVIKAPSIRYDHEVIVDLTTKNIEVITDIEYAYREFNFSPPVITGTNGKTTTLRFCSLFLGELYTTKEVGNVGYPIFDFYNNNEYLREFPICEVSSFQAEGIKYFKSKIVIFTNISKAHQDHHGTITDYYTAKLNLLKNNSSDTVVIYDRDNKTLDALVHTYNGKKRGFSLFNDKCYAYVKKGAIFYKNEKIIKTSDITYSSNAILTNILAAIILAKEYGVSSNYIRECILKFKPLEHRVEYVTKNIINNSKSTNVISTKVLLESIQTKKILICGGYSRNESYFALDNSLENLEEVLIFGNAKDTLKKYFDRKGIYTHIFDTLDDIVRYISRNYKKRNTYIFSPMHASYDMYNSYEERGNHFKELVYKYGLDVL